MKTEEAETDLNPSQNTAGITAQSGIDLTEITQGHKDGTETTNAEAVQGDPTQHTGDTVTGHTMTHHIGHITDHPHIAAFWVINPEVVVGHIHDHPTYLWGMNQADQVHTPAGHEEGHTPKKNMKVKIKDLHTDYYSSDDHSSSSGEESESLN